MQQRKPIQCPNSRVPVHIAHENLCSKFYSCYNYIPNELQCPKGLLFDTDEFICKNASQVNCGDRIRDNNNEIIDEYAQRACFNKTNENVQNPQNCSSYYRCTNGIAVIEHCPANLYFNVKTNSCDWYFNVNCCEHKREY